MADSVIRASAPVPGKQSLEDAYAEPDNFLEIDVLNPQTNGFGSKRYTDYEVRVKVRPSAVLSDPQTHRGSWTDQSSCFQAERITSSEAL